MENASTIYSTVILIFDFNLLFILSDRKRINGVSSSIPSNKEIEVWEVLTRISILIVTVVILIISMSPTHMKSINVNRV